MKSQRCTMAPLFQKYKPKLKIKLPKFYFLKNCSQRKMSYWSLFQDYQLMSNTFDQLIEEDMLKEDLILPKISSKLYLDQIKHIHQIRAILKCLYLKESSACFLCLE